MYLQGLEQGSSTRPGYGAGWGGGGSGSGPQFKPEAYDTQETQIKHIYTICYIFTYFRT